MNHRQSVFAQLLGFAPFSHFEHLVERFASNHGIKHFSSFAAWLFALGSLATPFFNKLPARR